MQLFSCEEAALEVQMLSVSVCLSDCLIVRLSVMLNFTGKGR